MEVDHERRQVVQLLPRPRPAVIGNIPETVANRLSNHANRQS